MKRLLYSLFLLLLLAVACGYHLVGTSTLLPEDVKKIYVPTFENATGQPELEQRLTPAVSNEISARGRFSVVASEEEADAILKGTITRFGLTPMALDAEGRATDYQVTLTLSVELTRRGAKKPLWKNASFTYRERYPIDNVAENYYDKLFQAVDALSTTFAQSLVTAILEGF